MISRTKIESVDKTKDLNPCICGCGRLTGRRFFSGCDTAYYLMLEAARDCGDQLAALVYAGIYGNNRRATYPKQRHLARMWRDRQQEVAAIAAD